MIVSSAVERLTPPTAASAPVVPVVLPFRSLNISVRLDDHEREPCMEELCEMKDNGVGQIVFLASLAATFAAAIVGRRTSDQRDEDDLAGRSLNRGVAGD
jgi:hypothetical protein